MREYFPFTGKWEGGRKGSGGYVPLVGGAGDVRIPDVLAPILGIVRKSIHITAYTETRDGMLIWGQNRPKTALYYPGKLDQTGSGYVKYGETEIEAINRLVHQELDGGRRLEYHMKWQKPVAYFTVRGDDACQLEGLAEEGIEVCRSVSVDQDWVPCGLTGNDEVGTFTPLTIEEAKTSLLNNEWKPGSALAMLRFLIDIGAVTEAGESELDEVMQMLYRELPHYMPQGPFP